MTTVRGINFGKFNSMSGSRHGPDKLTGPGEGPGVCPSGSVYWRDPARVNAEEDTIGGLLAGPTKSLCSLIEMM